MLKLAQRRMEAETYLTDGYGIRLAIEAKPAGWTRFSAIARASAPPRIKQILVSPENGVPYLNTSQVFDVRPKPRKWLAMGKTTKAEARLVKEGTILVMASATVGRAIVATKAHENAIISHHFMRVDPSDPTLAGWVYAYLRSPQAQAMMSGSQYASVIRHIEPHHLATLPVPDVSDEIARDFSKRVAAIVACRNKAAAMTEAAESAFARAIGHVDIAGAEEGFTVRLSDVISGRRRFEGAYHAPRVRAIIRRFKKWDLLGKITSRVWWGNRFRRHYGDSGIPYLSADDVFTTNPYWHRRILVKPDDGHESFFVKSGWLIMACSGQIYGMNGSTAIASEWHENTFFSHDMIRIKPKEGARAGYLLTALSHPALGRPLLIREAYGTSIPHLDPDDVAAFPVVRLDKPTEDRIADFAETAAHEQAKAEVMERELADVAGQVVSDFLMKPSMQLAEEAADVVIARKRLAEIETNPERVLRGPALEAQMKQWES
ncbi:MAG: hypothetical protein ABSE69_04480 [Roseiarcus sp.]|jgi:hypothetical protein